MFVPNEWAELILRKMRVDSDVDGEQEQEQVEREDSDFESD